MVQNRFLLTYHWLLYSSVLLPASNRGILLSESVCAYPAPPGRRGEGFKLCGGEGGGGALFLACNYLTEGRGGGIRLPSQAGAKEVVSQAAVLAPRKKEEEEEKWGRGIGQGEKKKRKRKRWKW